MLDVGTNNEALRGDPLYIGLAAAARARRRVRRAGRGVHRRDAGGVPRRRRPVRGLRQPQRVPAARAVPRPDLHVQRRHPGHGGGRARRASSRRCASPAARSAQQTLLFLGAGEAATGIADLAVAAMVAQGARRGRGARALLARRLEGARRQEPHGSRRSTSAVRARARAGTATCSTAVKALKPTAIIGVAAVGGAFTPEVLAAMAAINERPIVFALSNPTSKSECTAEEAYAWTRRARALRVAAARSTRSPSAAGRYVPRQGNNSYIFPGVGLGAIVCRRAAGHRRDVPRGRAHAGRAGDRRRSRAGQPVSAARRDPRRVRAHRGRGGGASRTSRAWPGRRSRPTILAGVQYAMYEPRYATYAA